ncbi:RIP metalloprotease RseP [Alteriqipengyuania lutimaris]|uniref:Zinc metalloprotease n=1 Tax=Alteriqipengyuania lutimaris TaxID=1538146 RepID=A0A395LMN8_9SPHN|nr:RIP metalloprotease RseP [Alteriqipengyuania lutimaris]MBB3032570.1 regulator of sigma E protease [Alteriqipengyuania lutimaris]RDS78303.1 RIP metalloprotease RseP [Alteriqipengyuania lutimaris]
MIEQPPIWMWVLGFLLVLGPLVTLHELGHLLVGRMLGVKAETFSVGFGKELVGFNDRQGTRWRLSALPLGGYVQFKGDMNPASVPDPSAPAEEGAFQNAALWKRALIVAAGPVTNILIALAIFAGFFMLIGRPVPVDATQQLTVAGFSDPSPAQVAGVEVGDRIVTLDGDRVESFGELQQAVMLHPEQRMELGVERDGETMSFALTTMSREVEDRFGNTSRIGLLGVESAGVEYDFVPQGPIAALSGSVEQSIDTFSMMITGLSQIVTGQRSVRELGGPVKIAKFSGEQLSLGFSAFVNFVALISLNLAFINLLPIPALDGGHLAFYAAEAIRRKPVGPRVMEMAYRTGVALVLALMLFVTINDLASLTLFG